MAQIINKRTPEIMANRRPTGLIFVTVTDKCFYFPKSVSHLIGLKASKFMHFINDGDYWAFYINEDTDGFKLNQDKPGTYRVDDRALVRMFLKSTGKRPGGRYFVSMSGSTHIDSSVYEIFTKSTVEVLVKKEKALKEQRRKVLSTVKQAV